MARINQRNYYRLLHVQHDAPVEVIKASYRTIMQKLKQHPDLGGDGENASLLNEAFAVLSSPEKRARYDRKRFKFRAPGNGQYYRPRTTSGKQTTAAQYGVKDPCYCPFCRASIPEHKIQGGAFSDCLVCDSPLTPVKKNRQASSGKRALKRTPVRGLVYFLTSWPQLRENIGEIQNLSPMGLKFFNSARIPLNSMIKIDSHGLKAVGRVVSCFRSADRQTSGYYIGVEFITLSYRAAHGVFVSEKA